MQNWKVPILWADKIGDIAFAISGDLIKIDLMHENEDN